LCSGYPLYYKIQYCIPDVQKQYNDYMCTYMQKPYELQHVMGRVYSE